MEVRPMYYIVLFLALLWQPWLFVLLVTMHALTGGRK